MLFETDKCVIHAKKNLKRIGLTKEDEGLFYNSNVGLVSNVFVNKNSDKNVVVPPKVLCHLRHGHLSHDRMKHMNKMYNYIPTNVHITS